MKLLVFILNEIELLEEVLEGFAQAKIGGATILSSRGMARELYRSGKEDDMFLGSLRAILDPDREENRTILTVLREEQVALAVQVIEDVVGDLTKPDSGILFTLPIDYIKGIK